MKQYSWNSWLLVWPNQHVVWLKNLTHWTILWCSNSAWHVCFLSLYIWSHGSSLFSELYLLPPGGQNSQLVLHGDIGRPTFDGHWDAWIFTNWSHKMSQFFEQIHLLDEQKVRFARMKLISRAKEYLYVTEKLISLL